MTIAVTGAAGFIGQHVLTELNRRGESVIALVRPGGSRPAAGLADRIIELDIYNPPKAVLTEIGAPDCVIHLAWGDLDNFKSPRHMTRELPAHRSFLSELLDGGLATLVVLGTCLEYGLQAGPLQPSQPTKPITPYGDAKDQLHQALQVLAQDHSVRLAWGRLFYTYGPGQPARTIRSLLETAVARGDKTFPMSGGQQVRDYLPVEAVAAQICDLALSDDFTGTYNICSGEGVTIEALVENWIAQENWSIKLELGRYPYPDYEPMAFWGETMTETLQAQRDMAER